MAKTKWKTIALEAQQELAELKRPKQTGRRPKLPRTPDGSLIADAIAILGWTRGQLADEIAKRLKTGFRQSQLTRANHLRNDGGLELSEEHRSAIAAIVKAHVKN